MLNKMATPAARRVAQERNIDLWTVRGTGAGGYIQEADVLAHRGQKATFVARAAARYLEIPLEQICASAPDGVIRKNDVLAAKGTASGGKRIPVNGMRRTIAAKMRESLSVSAQYTLMGEADCGALQKKMKEFSGRCMERVGIKPTYSDFFIRAAALALKENRMLNSRFMEDHILIHEDINIGLAVSLGERGLIVPNIKNADRKTLDEIVQMRAELVKRAREGRLEPDDYAGGTFSISNFGRSAVRFFTPIINQPESAVLGIGNMVERPVVREGAIEARPQLGLSLTIDHRHIDGTTGEKFLRDFSELLEHPERME